MKILMPVDGSDHTKRMLAYVAGHGNLFAADNEYTVFTAVSPIPAHAARFLDHRVVEEYYAEQAEQVLGPVRAFAAEQGWKVQEMHRAGHAAEAIVTLATKMPAELIVMGSHGHSALGGAVLGSVASGVLARCQVPVLLIR